MGTGLVVCLLYPQGDARWQTEIVALALLAGPKRMIKDRARVNHFAFPKSGGEQWVVWAEGRSLGDQAHPWSGLLAHSFSSLDPVVGQFRGLA